MPGPIVTNVFPWVGGANSDPVSSAGAVTITGTGFGVSAVLFGDVPAESFQIVSETEITAVPPSQDVGVVDITVVTDQGTSPTSPEDKFTYGTLFVGGMATMQSDGTQVSPGYSQPVEASSEGGDYLILYGKGFLEVTSVNVGAESISVTPANDGQLEVQLPAVSDDLKLTTVEVTVTTPSATSAVSPYSILAYTS
jgi:hypothetical protein